MSAPDIRHMPGWRIALLCVVLFAGACSQAPAERVRIVFVDCEPRMGAADCVTVVEFPDGERRSRMLAWGREGDEFMARRPKEYGWQ